MSDFDFTKIQTFPTEGVLEQQVKNLQQTNSVLARSNTDLKKGVVIVSAAVLAILTVVAIRFRIKNNSDDTKGK